MKAKSAAIAVMLALVLSLPCIAGAAETTPTVVTLSPESVAALSSSIASDLAPALASSAPVMGAVEFSADAQSVLSTIGLASVVVVLLLALMAGLAVMRR